MIEKELFEVMKTLVPDLEQTEEFSYYDCYSKFYGAYFELKCRTVHYDDLLIEKYKYDKLKKVDAWYINSTPKGIYSFDIQNIEEPNWVEDFMPLTTAFENHTLIKKLVGYLHISLAKKLM
jgi:hypothetical protein